MIELALALHLAAVPLAGAPRTGEPLPQAPALLPHLPHTARVVRPSELVQSTAADAWLGNDKFRHLLLSYAVTSFSFGALRSAGADRSAALAGAVGAAALAGVGKEIHDVRGGGPFSVRDLVADGLGIAAAYFLLREVR